MASTIATAPVVDRPAREPTQQCGSVLPAERPVEAAGFQTTRRLARELELLDKSLRAAERAAVAAQPYRRDDAADGNSDVASRRAELDRRETELQERQCGLERQRILLEQVHERLLRGKASLKRAISRFSSRVAQRAHAMDTRERRLAASRLELLEARRDFAREQMRLKAIVRESFQAPASAEWPDTATANAQLRRHLS